MEPGLTRAAPQGQICWGGRPRAHVQVDAEQGGDDEGRHSQLQEVAVDVGEVHSLVGCCCYRCTAEHKGKKPCGGYMHRGRDQL